jgi:hypothetical protein
VNDAIRFGQNFRIDTPPPAATLRKMQSALGGASVGRGLPVESGMWPIQPFRIDSIMKTCISFSSIFPTLAVAGLAINVVAADKKVPTISVAPSKAQNVAYWQPTMGEGLAQMLVKVQKDKSMGEYPGAAQISEDWAVTDASVDIEKLD